MRRVDDRAGDLIFQIHCGIFFGEKEIHDPVIKSSVDICEGSVESREENRNNH
jgi:hypothetical protein